mgnify:CR=1 FL=1
MKLSVVLGLTLCLSVPLLCWGQSQKREMTLEEVESSFVKKNFLLIAGQFGVEEEKAQVIQAGLWINPEISINQNIYNQETRKHFDTGKNGQSQIQIMQGFSLTGRIQKAKDAARMNAKSAEEGFFDLMRNLKLELRSNYFNLHFKSQILSFYEESLVHLNKTLEIVEKNFNAGNITMMELMRIRGVVFQVEDDKKNLLLQVIEHQQNLSVMLGESGLLVGTVLSDALLNKELTADVKSIDESLKLAYDSRPDLRALDFSYRAEKFNLDLQRARAMPDLKLGAEYDRNSNYIRDYYGLLVSFDIPLFDRNQGNIKSAAAKMNSLKARSEHLKLEIEKEIRLAHSKVIENDKLYKRYKNRFADGISKLAPILNSNYQKKYISSLEFSDSFDSLRASVSQYLLLETDRFTSAENFNFSVGRELISFYPQSGK